MDDQKIFPFRLPGVGYVGVLQRSTIEVVVLVISKVRMKLRWKTKAGLTKTFVNFQKVRPRHIVSEVSLIFLDMAPWVWIEILLLDAEWIAGQLKCFLRFGLENFAIQLWPSCPDVAATCFEHYQQS